MISSLLKKKLLITFLLFLENASLQLRAFISLEFFVDVLQEIRDEYFIRSTWNRVKRKLKRKVYCIQIFESDFYLIMTETLIVRENLVIDRYDFLFFDFDIVDELQQIDFLQLSSVFLN